MEVLWGSGQRWGVAVAIVHSVDSKRSMACGFWYAFSDFETLLENRYKKVLNAYNVKIGLIHSACDLNCIMTIKFTSVVSDSFPVD